MTADWYVVKYVADVFKDEPHNLGVIVVGPHGAAARFAGEGDDGSFDGRKVKNMVASTETYKAWIDYLRYRLRNREFEDAVHNLLARRLDNYRVHHRGRLLTEPTSADEFDAAANDLFHELVSVSAPSAPDLNDIANELLFRKIRLPHGLSIEKDVEYKVDVRGQSVGMQFDYRYANGATTLMDRVGLSGQEVTVTRRVHDFLFRIEHVAPLGDYRFMALYDLGNRGYTRSTERHLGLLEKYGFTVNVRSDDATEQIKQALGVLTDS